MKISPTKSFNYVIEIDGIEQFLVQTIEIPEITIEEVQHGAALNQPHHKTPGKAIVGDLVLGKLVPVDESEYSAYDWYGQVLSGNRALFARQGVIRQLGDDKITAVRSFVFTDAWAKGIATSSIDYTSNGENLIETLTISIHQWRPQSGVASAEAFINAWETFI